MSKEIGKLTAGTALVELGTGDNAMPNPTPIAAAAAALAIPTPPPFTWPIKLCGVTGPEDTMLPNENSAGPLNPVTGVPTELWKLCEYPCPGAVVVVVVVVPGNEWWLWLTLCVRECAFEYCSCMGEGCSEDEIWWSEYSMEGGRRRSAMALAMRTRLPNAIMPISDLRRLASSSRSTSPVISCSEGRD